MSGPTFVVLPATGEMPRSQEEQSESKLSTACSTKCHLTDGILCFQVASTIQRALQERQHPTQEGPGPIKQMLGKAKRNRKSTSWKLTSVSSSR